MSMIKEQDGFPGMCLRGGGWGVVFEDKQCKGGPPPSQSTMHESGF